MINIKIYYTTTYILCVHNIDKEIKSFTNCEDDSKHCQKKMVNFLNTDENTADFGLK